MDTPTSSHRGKYILIGAGIIGLAVLAYYLWQQHNASAVAAAPATTPAGGTGVIPVTPIGATTVTPTTSGVVTTTGGTGAAASSLIAPVFSTPPPMVPATPTSIGAGAYTAGGGTIAVPDVVTSWANNELPTNNRAQFFKMLPSMKQSDIDGLVDIITNDWHGNHQTTAAQTAFWNAWRVKYHIQDGTIAG